MLLTAADELDIDLGESWMIGNTPHDIEAGLRAGCKTILIDLPSRQKQSEPGGPAPHYEAVNITEAVNVIKKYPRRRDDSAPTAETPATDETEPAPKPDEPVTQEPETVVEVRQPAAQEPEPLTQEPDPVAEEAETESPSDEPESTDQADQQQSQRIEHQAPPPERETAPETTEQLLSDILNQLKATQRSTMFDEFSIMRFIAGIVQMVVLLCLLITIWLLMDPNRQDTSVLIALGFATVLQIMALTFFAMQDRK